MKRLLVVFLLAILVGCTETPGDTYSITFHPNGGNEVDRMEYEEGDTIVMPEDPTKDGYTFDAWYTDEALTGLFQTTEMPPFDIDLYAKWEETTSSTTETISVTYITQGGTTVSDAEYIVGNRMVAPQPPTKSGYEFVGWSTTQFCNSIYNFGDAPDDDLILYACWQEDDDNTTEDITITFNSNGGTTVSTMTVTPGDNISPPTNPTRSGFTFGGWYTEASLNSLFIWNDAPNSNITLYAKWIPDSVDSYTVTFNSNGGSSVSIQTVEDGQTATEPTDPTRSGYTFDGWYSNSELSTLYNFSSTVTSNITLHAKWIEDAPETFTVTFDSNGGSSVSTQTVVDGQTATEPADPTRSGYTFDGWYSNSTLTTGYNFGNAVTTNITLYAKWTEIQTSTPADDVIAVLLASNEDWTCSNNVCTYEEYSWRTYTIDLNNVTFKLEEDITDDQDPSYSKTETLTIDSNWNVDYRITESVGNTSMRLTGNALTGNYNMVSFSSSIYEENDYYDDMVAVIEGGQFSSGMVGYYEYILDTAGVTLDDLT